MDAHIRRTADHQKHGEETHHIVAGEEEYVEEGHERKSLLNKVKDKAKKIKSKITPKHHTGRPDGHDHNPDVDNHPSTQINQDSEDESIEPDPEVHGAPMYDSRDSGRIGDVDELSDKMRDNSLDTDAPGKSNTNGIHQSETDGQATGRSHVHFAQDPSTDNNTPSNDANRAPAQENQGQPTTYTEKISAAASTIATTAVSAKDAIIEKLGYGHKDGQDQHTVKEGVRVEETEGGVKKVKSGGQTVPEYLTDKLGPGGEERPLSQVVSDVLHKRKDMQDEPAVDQSDHRREPNEGTEPETESGGPQGIIGTVASFFNKGGEANDAYGAQISGDPQEKSSPGNQNRH